MTAAGPPVSAVELTAHTLSELLRLFLKDSETASADLDHVSSPVVQCLRCRIAKNTGL